MAPLYSLSMLHIDLSRRYFLTLLGSGLVASTAAARAQPLIVDVKVGREKATDSLLSLVSRAAHTDDAVLISGGTSAEMESIARAIHKRSPRAGRFFVPMRNLASIPPTLIPAELVGHEKLKAAVGTIRWRPGRIELAHLGTLFIHDITELPRDMVLHCSGYGFCRSIYSWSFFARYRNAPSRASLGLRFVRQTSGSSRRRAATHQRRSLKVRCDRTSSTG